MSVNVSTHMSVHISMHMSTQFEVELGDDFAQCIAAANDVVPTMHT